MNTQSHSHYWVHYDKFSSTYTVRIAPGNFRIPDMEFSDRKQALAIAARLNDAYNSGASLGYQAGFIEAADTLAPHSTPTLSAPVETLALPKRALNCLKREGIDTVIQLISQTQVDIYRIKNLGEGSFDAIVKALAMRGLGLRER